MKSKFAAYSIVVILFIGMMITFAAFKNPPQNPQPKYSVTLSGQEWQAIISYLTNSDDYSTNQKKQAASIIQNSLTLVDTSKTKK